jgi:hypothetical protein
MRKTPKNFKYLITFVLFSILLASCEKDISDTSQPPGTETVNVFYGCQNDDNCAVQCCLGDLKVAESWARGVQWELTRMVYPPTIMVDYPIYTNIYTGVVQDMIDGISGNDQVTGYTIRQIEDALPGQLTWNAWKTNIKNLYNNATENNLDALFNYWD